MSRPRRFGLIVFGAILVALFAVIAIANGGVGKPSVPSGDIIYVQEVPDGLGNISQDDYNRSFEQTWKRGGLKSAPKEGDAQYDQVKEAAINDLLDQAWLTGEAEELGVSATDREVASELETIKKDQFPTPKAFSDFLKTSGFTAQEVEFRVKLQVLSRKIQDQITKSVTDVPDSEIEDFYDSSKESFTTPETRDIRLIVTDKKADADKAAKEKQATAKADNCKRAQQAKAMYDTGKAVRMPNEKGEMVFQNAEQRATEVKRTDEAIFNNC